eukprot:scaffold16368_cov73-Cyclotella_meneghiniana.AAC.1
MEYVWIDSGISQHLHYKYDEWLKVEIGVWVWALKWSPQCVFDVRVGSKLAYLFSTVDADFM